MIFATTNQLAALSQTERDAIAALPRDVAAHDAHLAALPCMAMVEIGGTAPTAPLAFPFTVAAWNLERCLFPAASAAKIATTSAQVVLLSEMDNGMARTAQTHTTAAVAAPLAMSYAYGVEFIELGLGSETELEFCTDTHNDAGFHGNAILAATPLSRPFLLRLPGRRFWFLSGGDQPRLGERMAIGALIQTEAGPIVMVSTHLESNADASQRAAQMRLLIDALDANFSDLPLLIGGDLNTGNHIGGDWRDETLFDHARGRGFTIHGGADSVMTTRPSLITRWPDRAMKLDWFLTRGLQIAQCQIIASTDEAGRPLSDHDMIVLQVVGLNR
ncbi:endonuclease/exonuclease/phosphatase family protein [Cypionkella sp.]|jgi:endonuclease/exonuclease/phosphatase family metal-dependent hydrolase|uniref:endonuclease/exonuclease/phosphatase family protein n=1 Tax=Cypionkella sp. TaxID=2811411 RepID=UPI00271FBC51|nr:endonuclease/exonuclease/phosphatase family protein [Cypionkella sp.]MDO8984377.1 endonuclease [Cypionkella sp.]MDP1577364.1 endonuclease [Cypionkella sp.]MDP2048050.1 endonuclease [Cypionkella sp.]